MSRAVYKAVIYVERADERGNMRLDKVTTSQWVTVPQIAASVGVVPAGGVVQATTASTTTINTLRTNNDGRSLSFDKRRVPPMDW